MPKHYNNKKKQHQYKKSSSCYGSCKSGPFHGAYAAGCHDNGNWVNNSSYAHAYASPKGHKIAGGKPCGSCKVGRFHGAAHCNGMNGTNGQAAYMAGPYHYGAMSAYGAQSYSALH